MTTLVVWSKVPKIKPLYGGRDREVFDLVLAQEEGWTRAGFVSPVTTASALMKMSS